MRRLEPDREQRLSYLGAFATPITAVKLKEAYQDITALTCDVTGAGGPKDNLTTLLLARTQTLSKPMSQPYYKPDPDMMHTEGGG